MPLLLEFKIKGHENVIKNIEKFQNLAERELGYKMLDVVTHIVGDAKYLAPVDTGYLREHITASVTRKRVWIIGTVRSTAPYSLYQEFGSSRNVRHPYMRPAFNKNIDRIIRDLGDTLRTVMIQSADRSGPLGRRIY